MESNLQGMLWLTVGILPSSQFCLRHGGNCRGDIEVTEYFGADSEPVGEFKTALLSIKNR
ncbi:MAG: hypothetical protein BVN35_16005 [Proteobacteria bacterium ST_bin11]|nr:MAG: hypothetical protein BVN35_16005 [Proteobacteria bacterium ST_bin11]